MRAVLTLPVLLAVAAGCAVRPPVTTSRAIPEGATPVAVRRDDTAASIFQGNSGMSDSARLVVRNETDWRNTWTQLVGHISPAPALPPVDFTKEMVLVAAMGMRPTAGHTIRIARAGSISGVTYVEVVSEKPGARCQMAQMMSAPADVVVVPRGTEPVTFVESYAVKVC
jgi:hypothetical protein